MISKALKTFSKHFYNEENKLYLNLSNRIPQLYNPRTWHKSISSFNQKQLPLNPISLMDLKTSLEGNGFLDE